jgi:periplasmic protein CpxP/Spy
VFKRSLFLAALSLLTISLYGLSANAQEQGPNGQDSMAQGGMTNDQHEHGRGGHGQMDPAARVKELTQKLSLSSDQQSKIRSILEDQQKQVAQLRNDSSMSQQDRRSKFMELHQNAASQIRSVLNDDQQKKFDAMQQQHKNREGKQRGGWNEAPPSGQSNPQNPQ